MSVQKANLLSPDPDETIDKSHDFYTNDFDQDDTKDVWNFESLRPSLHIIFCNF